MEFIVSVLWGGQCYSSNLIRTRKLKEQLLAAVV